MIAMDGDGSERGRRDARECEIERAKGKRERETRREKASVEKRSSGGSKKNSSEDGNSSVRGGDRRLY